MEGQNREEREGGAVRKNVLLFGDIPYLLEDTKAQAPNLGGSHRSTGETRKKWALHEKKNLSKKKALCNSAASPEKKAAPW